MFSTNALARRTSGLLLVMALLAAGCGNDSSTDPGAGSAPDQQPAPESTQPASPSAPDEEPAFPTTVQADNGEVTVESPPQRIVSLSATATEMLFAIGAGGQVVAVDEFSDYPDEAPTTDLSGFQPNIEAIAAYEPDLVIASSDPGDLEASLAAAGIPTLLYDSPLNVEGSYLQIERLGAATGHAEEAAAVIAEMQTRIDALVAASPRPEEALTYYHELDPTLFTVTSGTFVGEMYALLGLENVADAANGTGLYPQMSPEYLIEADPDLIFLADAQCCDVTADSLAARPGWDRITAVREGNVIELDEDVASRWGPRIVDLLEVVAARLVELEAVAGRG